MRAPRHGAPAWWTSGIRWPLHGSEFRAPGLRNPQSVRPGMAAKARAIPPFQTFPWPSSRAVAVQILPQRPDGLLHSLAAAVLRARHPLLGRALLAAPACAP